MRNAICFITVASILAAPAAFAAKASREENTGVGSGALVGAIAGGPAGLIIGAAIGAKLGDTIHRKNEALVASEQDLKNVRRDLVTLNQSYDAVSAKLEEMQQMARPELAGMLQAGIEVDLLFRTGEYVLANATAQRLDALATTLASLADVKVRLDGFADERGDESYNYKLSAQRVESVRDQLLNAGIDAARIQVQAHGESPAQDETADSYALERRVSLTLFIDDPETVAQLPD